MEKIGFSAEDASALAFELTEGLASISISPGTKTNTLREVLMTGGEQLIDLLNSKIQVDIGETIFEVGLEGKLFLICR